MTSSVLEIAVGGQNLTSKSAEYNDEYFWLKLTPVLGRLLSVMLRDSRLSLRLCCTIIVYQKNIKTRHYS